ncbi:MAG TPA: hypothetical protein VNC59_04310, partial [Thermoanaerobaculia bacterium]|nr:hypothetical protein [Thermoanaerobaculia bacterium]
MKNLRRPTAAASGSLQRLRGFRGALLPVAALLLFAGCSSTGPSARPSERERFPLDPREELSGP